jgi:hypothetical protein
VAYPAFGWTHPAICADFGVGPCGDISRCGWLKADVIVDGVSEPLLAAQVSLRSLDADVTEQELDLLKLTACLVTQARTSSPLMPHAA